MAGDIVKRSSSDPQNVRTDCLDLLRRLADESASRPLWDGPLFLSIVFDNPGFGFTLHIGQTGIQVEALPIYCLGDD